MPDPQCKPLKQCEQWNQCGQWAGKCSAWDDRIVVRAMRIAQQSIAN
jgi:hypothetical protein